VGLQVGIRLGSYLNNPYFIGIGGNSGCQDVKVTNVRTDTGPNTAPVTSSCGGTFNLPTQIQSMRFEAGATGVGLNLAYLPWNLSANVFNDYEKDSSIDGGLDFKIYTLSMGFTF